MNTNPSPQGTNRKTATIVGVLFIIGTVAGILSLPVMGGILGAPDVLNLVAANPSQVAFGALLMLVMGLALAMVPAMMFPILKRQNEPLAIGYVIFRGALETFTTLALAMCWLLLVVVARQYADSGAAVASQWGSLGILLVKAPDTIMTVGGIVFGLGALMLYSLLYQARLIPRWISAWGIVAAVAYCGRELWRHVRHDSGHLGAADAPARNGHGGVADREGIQSIRHCSRTCQAAVIGGLR